MKRIKQGQFANRPYNQSTFLLTMKLKIIIIEIMKTLADLKPSETGRIHAVTGVDGLSQRLAEMGFTPGQPVQVVRFAPFGDPIQIRIRGFNVALRKSEARRVALAFTS